MTQRIGLLGGTFDPIHYGHLIAASVAMRRLALDEIWLVPCGEPPHKPASSVTPAVHRYAMALLAVADRPRFRVSRIELDRAGPSYTADTLAQIAAAMPQAELTFIVGADSFQSMARWRTPERIFAAARVAVVSRPGYNDDALMRDQAALPAAAAGRIDRVPIAPLAISASDIRGRVARGQSILPYVPPAVAAYIAHHRLYQDPA